MKYIIALGSNLGNRKDNIKQAISKISEFAIIESASSIYETKALVPNDSPKNWDQNFYNAVLLITVSTAIDAHQLLAKLKLIESSLGRKMPERRWAPRVIDLDIILGPQEISTDELIIPHPQFAMRDFVVVPMQEIASDYHINQSGETVAELDAKTLYQNIIGKIA